MSAASWIKARPRAMAWLVFAAGGATAILLAVLLMWATDTLNRSTVVAMAATLGIAGAVVAGVLIQRPSWRFVLVAVVAAASFYAGRHMSADLTTPLLGLAVGGALTALSRP